MYNDINISYYEKIPKLVKSPYYRLDVSSKFCHFHNVLKTLDNSYQQTHHWYKRFCHSMFGCQDIFEQ